VSVLLREGGFQSLRRVLESLCAGDSAVPHRHDRPSPLVKLYAARRRSIPIGGYDNDLVVAYINRADEIGFPRQRGISCARVAAGFSEELLVSTTPVIFVAFELRDRRDEDVVRVENLVHRGEVGLWPSYDRTGCSSGQFQFLLRHRRGVSRNLIPRHFWFSR
jgi:hypothetical protein